MVKAVALLKMPPLTPPPTPPPPKTPPTPQTRAAKGALYKSLDLKVSTSPTPRQRFWGFCGLVRPSVAKSYHGELGPTWPAPLVVV